MIYESAKMRKDSTQSDGRLLDVDRVQSALVTNERVRHKADLAAQIGKIRHRSGSDAGTNLGLLHKQVKRPPRYIY